MQAPLFDLITVHCFWGRCPHVVQDHDPRAAHAAMERHYETKHRAHLDALVGRIS